VTTNCSVQVALNTRGAAQHTDYSGTLIGADYKVLKANRNTHNTTQWCKGGYDGDFRVNCESLGGHYSTLPWSLHLANGFSRPTGYDGSTYVDHYLVARCEEVNAVNANFSLVLTKFI
jgi:hypothetical protein